MKRFTNRLIYVIGLFTLLSAFYISSFYLVSDRIIRPFEKTHDFESHAIRPIYNFIYYPMRLFTANGSSFSQDVPDIYFGTISKRTNSDFDDPNHRSLNIDQIDGGWLSIGFTGRKSMLRKFDNVENGSYLRLVFGRALANKHDRFINRLIGFEVIDLMDDPRIEEKKYSDEERKRVETLYRELKGMREECTRSFVSDYKELVLKHCLEAGYARNIGGGCFHLAPYTITTSVLEEALSVCPIVTD